MGQFEPTLVRIFIYCCWTEIHKRNNRLKDVRKNVVCFYSSFLKSLGQVKPNLVGMFIVICMVLSNVFVFVNRKYTKETRGQKVSGCCLWRVYFSTNLDNFFLFLFLIKLYLYSMVSNLLRLLLFPRYKRVKMGQTPEICNLYFKSDFHNFFFRFLLKFPTCSFVYQIWPSS